MQTRLLLQNRQLLVHPGHVNPNSWVIQDKNALLVYTAGRTGQPKGVLIDHTTLLNQVRIQNCKLGFFKHQFKKNVLAIVVFYLFNFLKESVN